MGKTAADVVKKARKAFESGKTKSYEFRLNQLKQLLRFIEENQKLLVETLIKENKKPKTESTLSEIQYAKNEVKNCMIHLKEWMEPKKPSKPLLNILDKVLIWPEPYGVVLIISPWNYPFMLTLGPLAGAIAAGNCVVIKPSELAPHSSALLEELLPKYLDSECFHVLTGGIPETTALLDERFDYIFYTGSTNVGKIVHKAASKYLTPITLELGGKSPVYVDDDVDMEIVAARVMWGKCLNVGQSCIGPDYLLCSKNAEQRFIHYAKLKIKEWYGDKLKSTSDFGRIINDGHFTRITNLLKGCKIAMGGSTDASDRFIEPTVVTDVKAEDAIMQEEIFGPILPIYTVNSPEEAIDFINSREKPLALYVFSKKKNIQDKFLNETSSGGVCINDVLMHFSCDSLPFGGVGYSGSGAYHGQLTFETFSHNKAALVKSLDKFGEYAQSIRYPPYSDKKLDALSTLSAKKNPIPLLKSLPTILIYLLGILTGISSFWYFQV